MRTGDTIAAVSSCPGWSPRGVIRISGGDAFGIIDSLLLKEVDSAGGDGSGVDRERIGRKMRGEWGGRGVRVGRLRVGGMGLPCMLAYFPGPGSYTGEDTVEVATSGNVHLLNRILQFCYQVGARPAEAGEFSFRAYANGRLTLAQAEGVAATITAASDAELRAARMLTEGKLGCVCRLMSERLARALALVEAGIDFVEEEDIVPISGKELVGEAGIVIDEIDELLKRSVGMEELSDLPRVVLTGPANAGKSTLFNALLGRKRAVVSSMSGTTRDVLVEAMHLQEGDVRSAEILLVDVAGFGGDDGGGGDVFYGLMEEAARRAIDDADLVVVLREVGGGNDGDDGDVEWEEGKLVLRVLSKCDEISEEEERGGVVSNDYDIAISAKTGFHLAELRGMIGERLRGRMTTLAADAIALEVRHSAAFGEASEVLGRLVKQLEDGGGDEGEVIAAMLRVALDAIGGITGERITPDDILGRIFANFCIGK